MPQFEGVIKSVESRNDVLRVHVGSTLSFDVPVEATYKHKRTLSMAMQLLKPGNAVAALIGPEPPADSGHFSFCGNVLIESVEGGVLVSAGGLLIHFRPDGSDPPIHKGAGTELFASFTVTSRSC